MTQKKIEQNALIVSVIVNIVITGAGLWVFLATRIQALFLDFFFSFIVVLSAVTAIIISKISKKKTKHHPDGLYFLEPLYAIFKSLLTLALLVVSVFGTAASAYAYFTQGIGEPMNIGPILPYSIAMVVLCFGLGVFNKRQNKRINGTSTILTVESKANFIDGMLSLAVGVAIIPLYFIPLDSSLGFLHYTGDFFITVLLVLFSLKEPIKVLISSFRELSGGTATNKDLIKRICKTVDKHLKPMAEHQQCHVFKIGMQIKVRIHLSSKPVDIAALESARKKLLGDLHTTYENIEISFMV